MIYIIMFHLMPLPPIVSYFIKIRIGLTLLVTAYLDSHRKEAVKRASVLLLHFA